MHTLKKLALLAALLAAPFAANARSSYLTTFNSKYGTANTVLDGCSTCHGATTSTWNAYGNDVMKNIASGISAALTAVEPLDSDNDKYSNITEIKARSLPGDAKSVPAPTPTPAPKIGVSPTSLSFGTITVGATGTQTTVVSNTGTADLTVTAARCSGTSSEFTASPASFTVVAGGKATVTITYKPVDATTDTGCVALANNDAATGTVNVSVTGTGQAATPPPPAGLLDVDITRFVVAKRLDMSRGGTASPMVTVVNAGAVAGTATVTVEGVDAGNVGVYSASQDVTLAPGATAKLKFPDFTPTAAGDLVFTATVADADPDTDAASVSVKVIP